MIYISEAHAADEWPLSNKYKVFQHKNVEERVNAAKNFINCRGADYGERLYVDSVELPNYEKTYQGWPERGFVFYKGKIRYICFGVIEDKFRWCEEIDEWMKNNCELIN